MNKFSVIYLSILMVVFSGCYKTHDEMDIQSNQVILSYPAVNQFNLAASGIDFWSKALINPDLGKATDTLTFSLNMPNAVSQDVTVTIGIDQNAMAALQQDTIFKASNYALMPEAYYTIVNPQITIPAGQLDTTFKIAIKPSTFDISQTGYLLPISIVSANGVTIGAMKTAFIHIEKDPNPPLSRAGWSVVNFSSEEANGEGPDNGHVKHMFDNNNNTFWHSKWQGGTAEPPHWFTIDMGTSNVLNGIMFLDRQGVGSDGRPKDVKVEVSTDKTNWTVAGNLTLADNNKWQKIKFSNPTPAVQYFKVTITSMYGASTVKYTNLAELKVY